MISKIHLDTAIQSLMILVLGPFFLFNGQLLATRCKVVKVMVVIVDTAEVGGERDALILEPLNNKPNSWPLPAPAVPVVETDGIAG